MHYYYSESIEGFDLYVTNGLEGDDSKVEHLGVIYEESHASMICRLLNNKINSMKELKK